MFHDVEVAPGGGVAERSGGPDDEQLFLGEGGIDVLRRNELPDGREIPLLYRRQDPLSLLHIPIPHPV